MGCQILIIRPYLSNAIVDLDGTEDGDFCREDFRLSLFDGATDSRGGGLPLDDDEETILTSGGLF